MKKMGRMWPTRGPGQRLIETKEAGTRQVDRSHKGEEAVGEYRPF